jgi:hypothetical protein
MTDRIRKYIGLFFDELPFSEGTAEARRKIEKALEETAPNALPDELAAQYGSYEKLAALAGYTEAEAQAWRSTETLRDVNEVKKELRRQRWLAYLISALFAGLPSELVWTTYNAVHGYREFIYTLIYGVLLLAAALLLLKRFRRVERQHSGERIDAQTYEFLLGKSDQYTKRLLNSIALLFAALALFIGSELSFYFFGNSKAAELTENIFANMNFVQVPLFLLLKNTLLVRMMQNRIGRPDRSRLHRHAIGVTAFSLIYWLAVAAFVILMRESINYPANVFLIAGIVFALLILAYDLSLRRKLTFRNLVFNKPRVALFLAIVIILGGFTFMSRETYFTQPYINSLPVVEHRANPIEYNEESGVYTITAAGEDFKILHLTDIHLGGSLFSARQDIKALTACYTLIENTHPDLVIVTGDLSFPLGIMSMSFNNSAPVYQFAAFMRNLGIPWAFTYGNHDTESLASMDKEALNDVFLSLSYKTSGTLLYPYVQPEVTGRNNQLIELRNADGSLNTALFLIDSNAYTGEGINVYDYIHDDQVEWYAREVEWLNAEAGHTVPSMIFFHIPLQQYRTAYELYEAGSNEVTYYFGENGEKMINKVCCSDYPSSLFDRAREIGCEAMFCGHDHYNNMSLEYEGVRLTYGMSIDYLAMPGIENDTEQRGGELITIHTDGNWDLRQIPLVGLTQ